LHYADAGGWLEQYRVLQEYLISRKQEKLEGGANIGGLITVEYFCSQVDGAITRGAYNRNFTVIVTYCWR